MSTDTLIQTITQCAQAIQNTAVGCYLETQDENLKGEMDLIEERAKEICRAARALEEECAELELEASQ